MSERAVVSVSILTEHIKKILEKQDLFKGLRISGEISNLTKHSSGHWYFSLKDETSQIKCVMWKGNNAKIPFLVKDGMAVVVEADLAMYAQRSELQLVVKNMTNKEEIGSLHAQYLKRYETLEKQGYFAQSHKKALPAFPMDIAVLSAKQGAATQDVFQILKRRWPLASVAFYPCLVQGESADLDIIAKLKQADQGQHDLILLVRGGGSLEDLWCFNSEALVKTIYECESVVVVGVGHEPDHTLAEYVADVFAPTPSAAAELVTPNREDVESELVTLARKMKRAISHDVALHALALGNMKQHRYLQNPLRFIQNEQLLLALKIQELSAVREQTLQKRQQLDKIHAGLAQKQAMLLQNQYAQIERSQLGLRNATTLYLNQNKSAFASLMQLLDAYSPLHSIQRGYSVVYHDHHVVTSIHQVQPDDALTIRLSDGVVQATVCEKES